MIAFDLETTGLNKRKDKILGAFTCAEDLNKNVYRSADEMGRLKSIVSSDTTSVTFHNAPFDLAFLKRYSIPVKGPIHDTLIMYHLLNELDKNTGLKTLASKYLNDPCKEAKLYTEWTDEHGHENVPDEILIPYGAKDTEFTLKLHYLLYPEIERTMKKVYDMEIALINPIMEIEESGMQLDVKYCRTSLEKLFYEKKKALETVTKMLPNEINLDSPKQLASALFNEKPGGLGICCVARTPTGAPSTSEENLQLYNHPVVRAILDYRSLGKMEDFFTLFLAKREDGILYPTLNSCGTVTGRFSCSNPNLQQVPKEDKGTGRISVRAAFTVRKGYINVYIDYKQMEMVAFAWIAGEKALQDTILSGGDVHQMTGDSIGLSRWIGKVFNFSVIYGMGVESLAKTINQENSKHSKDVEITKVDNATAKLYLNRYHSQYPSIKRTMNSLRKELRDRGYCENFIGRRFRVPYYLDYKALNAVIQGTCADIVKLAMIAAHKYLKTLHDSRLLLQVHDEFIIQIPDDGKTIFKIPDLCRVIEGSNPTTIPFKVDVKISKTNWAEKKSIEQ